MHGCGRRAALPSMAIACVLAGCGAPPHRAALDVRTEPWEYRGAAGRRLITAHFDIRTTARDERLVAVLPGFLEECHERCARLTGRSSGSPDPLVVYVFETRAQWSGFTEEFAPQRAPLYRQIRHGGYTDEPTATAVLYDIGRDRTLAVAAHESMHQYLARHVRGPIPAWVNEGLATQMECFALRDGVPVFEPRHNLYRRNYLRMALSAGANRLYPLRDLLRMHAGELFSSPEQSSDTYYAQVWSLVLMLTEGRNAAYREGFRKLVAEVGTESMRAAVEAYRVAVPDAAGAAAGEVAFRRYICEDLNRFAREYEAFARDLVRTAPAGRFP